MSNHKMLIMKKQFILYAVFFFFLFPSCEKEALEPEMTSALDLNASAKSANQQKVLSFRAHLSGDAEVPPVETMATGQTIFKLNKDRTELRYKLIVANIDGVSMAHIHLGEPEENGGVVVWLYPDSPPPVPIEGTTNGILAEGVITAGDLRGDLAGQSLEALLEEMIAGGAYVNVHTAEHGGGEIRGQIEANNLK